MAFSTMFKINSLKWMLILITLSLLVILVFLRGITFKYNVLYLQSKDEDPSKSMHLAGSINGTQLTLNESVTHFKRLLAEKSDSTPQNFNNACGGGAGACTPNCSRPLSNSTDDRLKDILLSPNFTLSNQQRETILSMAESIPENDIIFVSASSSNHYDEMQAMFHSLHTVVFPMLPNVTVVLFDIGLTKEQREMTEKHCRCRVVTFPVEKFPPHMKDNLCYSWKPLIVRATMEKVRQILVYQDASIRWFPDMYKVLNLTKIIGLQYHRDDFFSRIPVHTIRQTFDYFGEEPCAFAPFPEIGANNAMYKKDPFIIHAVLEPWARCALEPSCMCPVAPKTVLSCSKPVADHRCHRFDQSALGMITAKLFNKDIHRILAPKIHFLDVRREHKMKDYFNSLGN